MTQNKLPNVENAGGEKPENHNSDNPNAKPIAGWLKVIAMFFAGIIYVLREPALQLKSRVYDLKKEGPFWVLSGLLVSLAAGIGLGYQLGWQYDYDAVRWVFAGLVGALATYFYAWPAVVHLFLKGYIRLSKKVWKYLDFNLDPFKPMKAEDWLSQTVYHAIGVLTIGFGILSFWFVMTFIHAQLAIGFAGYLFGGLAGLLVGVGSGFLGMGLLNFAQLPWCATVIGAALIYFLRSFTQQYLPTEAFGFNITGLIYALELALWAGFIYPLLHIALTRIFTRFFVWLRETNHYVYHQPKGGYREFFLQLANIATAIAVFFFISVKFAPILAVSAGALYTIASVASLFVYVVFGKALNFLDNSFLSLVSSLMGGYCAYQYVLTFQIIHSSEWAFAAGFVVFFLSMIALFPIAYVALKVVFQPLLSSWLRDPLVNMHDVLSKELANSYDNTYKDKNEDYIALFSQTVSFVATIAAFIGSSILLTQFLDLNLIMSILLEIVIVISAYLTFGKLVRRFKTTLISRFFATVIAIFLGTQTYAFSSFHHISYVIGAISFILTLWIVFPVIYVLLKTLILTFRADYLLRFFVKLFDRIETTFERLWTAILENYAAIKATLDPMFENFSRAFKESWEQINKSAGGKK
ncbi:MAG: hypothetical protein IAF58_02610 [Leptolyngbya sp.]|nr:hypothetical protein [Candidatus Melainabacteria bacterium]